MICMRQVANKVLLASGLGLVSSTGRVGVRVFEFAQRDQKFGTGGVNGKTAQLCKEFQGGEEPKQSCEEMTRGCDGDCIWVFAGAGL